MATTIKRKIKTASVKSKLSDDGIQIREAGGITGEKVGDFIFVQKSDSYWRVFHNGKKVAIVVKESSSLPNVLPYLAPIRKQDVFIVTSFTGKQEKFASLEDVKKAHREFKMEAGGKLYGSRDELIQLLTDTTNFEKSELKGMSTRELKDLHKSMEIPEWEEELEREKKRMPKMPGGIGQFEDGGNIPSHIVIKKDKGEWYSIINKKLERYYQLASSQFSEKESIKWIKEMILEAGMDKDSNWTNENSFKSKMENGGEIPFDLWEEYSHAEKVKFLDSIGMSTKYADYEWSDLTKSIQDKFETMAMTPTNLSDKDKVEMWYDIADESEVDEIIRELGYKPHKFKIEYDGKTSYPVFDELGENNMGTAAARELRREFIDYVIKNNPKIQEWDFPDKEQTIDDIIPGHIELKNGGKTPAVSKGDKITVINNDMFSGEEPEENSTVISILSPTKIIVSLGSDPTIQSYAEWIDNRWEITENVELKNGGKTPEIKGIGKFVPIAKIKEITKYYDDHVKSNQWQDAEENEAYSWLNTIDTYSILGDHTLAHEILVHHVNGKNPMDIHKAIKKLEDGGNVGSKIATHAGIETGLEAISENPELVELVALKNGGKSNDLSRSLQEIVDQSINTVEHRYLLGKLDEKEYQEKLGEIKSFAEKKGLEFEHGGKTNEKASLYFPDDKLDYTNQMLIDLQWITVGGRVEEFYHDLKNKGRQQAYDEIKKQYPDDVDGVYRTVLVLDRLKNMKADISALYGERNYKHDIEKFEKSMRKQLVNAGEYNNYLVSKPVLEWDNYDYANYNALKLKHNFEDGGKTESNDMIQQLIDDGFVNKDHTLTNKGKRIADLHKYCFPIGAHPFSYAQYTVDDLYSKPKYVTINDIIYYTDGFLVYELGGHLPDALRESAVQDHSLENSVNKTISKNLVEYKPYAYIIK